MSQRKIYASHAHRQAAYRRRCQEARNRQLADKGLPPLPALPAIPGTARWRVAIANATDLLSIVTDEMETYFDDRSEQWQESEKGEDFRERLDALCEAKDVVAECSLT